MKLKRLNFKTKSVIIILIFLSGFFIMREVSRAEDNDIIITEIMYDSGGEKGDWFEIFNNGESDINLKNLYLIDEFKLILNTTGDKYLNCHSINKEDYVLKTGKYIIIGENGGDFVFKALDLNGINEDAIRLSWDNCKTFFSELIYNPKKISIKKDYSLELDKNGTLRESANKGGSPGEKNPEKRDEEDMEQDDNKKEHYKSLKINEILPNPKGSDSEGEYIELYNFGEKDIDLGEGSGWIMEDRVGSSGNKYDRFYFSKYPKDKIVKAGEFLVIKRETGFSFAFSNEDEIILRDSSGTEIDRIEYEGAREGISYNFDSKTNKWRWSEFLTPGAKNEFKELGEVDIKIDEDIYKDIYANFEVSMSGIKDKDLKVKWEFGDGKNSYKAKTKHKYLENGKYVVKLKVSGSSEDIKKEFNIKVEDFPEKKVSILAINPNPEGKDTEGEWIELKNKSKKRVNLKNWSIATGSSKKKLTNHPIYEDFVIKAGKIKQLTREFSKFSLNNKKGYVELRYPNGEVAYDLKYKKEDGIDENEIYKKKEGGGWEWIKNAIKKIIKNTEEEDALKVENIDEGLIDEIKDLDLIRDMTPEDVGKYSEKEKEDLIENYLKEELVSLQDKVENISVPQKQVLGAWDNKIKKIRTEDAFYYFNPKGKEERHYLIKFWEDIVGVI